MQTTEPELIQDLRHQHREIIWLIEGSVLALEKQRMPDAKALLERLRTAVVEHLAMEDAQFYREMERASRHNEHVADMIHNFRLNMDNISRAVVAFFDEHPDLDDVARVPKDFAAIAKEVVSRIQAEETAFYALYPVLKQKAASP
jgi:hypothetical protein